MIKVSRIAVILALVMVFGSEITTSKAQAGTGTVCYDVTTDFPTGWNISHGTTDITAVGGTALFATTGTYNGIQSNYAVATLNLGSGVTLHGFTYQLLYSGLGDEQLVTADFQLYDAHGNYLDDDIKYTGYPNSFNIGTWQSYTTKDFNNSAVDHVVVIVKHDQTGSNPDNGLGIRIMSYCYDPSQPNPIPSPTGLPTNTQTATPSPSHTPTITLTPSFTPTPSQTHTPTQTSTPNLTTTETPTPTLGTPTQTLTTTSTPGTPLTGQNFNTVAAPSGCDDDPNNPCGAIPFQPPAFSTLSLSSPTYVASSTMFSTMGTPTYTSLQNTAIAIPTNIGAVSGAVQAESTFTITDSQGNQMSINDAANVIGQPIADFFAFIKSLLNLNFGKAAALLAFLFLITLFIVAIRVLIGIIRIIQAIMKLISKVVSSAATAGVGGE